MIPDDASLLQIHLDLKPQNVMISALAFCEVSQDLELKV